jgi:DNA polymerase-1
MSKLSLHQLPKSAEFLECFVPDPGHLLVSIDFAALEPKVLAYFSRDRNLLALYGPSASPHQDIYLYNACQMGDLGKRIRACGYDPNNPTPEAVARAKKECKDDRAVSKLITLAGNYGAGAPKIHKSLLQAGFDVTLKEVYGYHRAFWQAYAGIKLFEKKLQQQWYTNNGVLTNGRGRPLPVDDGSLKDLVNRFTQSTGHDLLRYFLLLLVPQLDLEGITWEPYIEDLHDESILEVPVSCAERTAELMTKTMDKLNEVLQWDVKFTGTPTVGRNLAEIKLAG